VGASPRVSATARLAHGRKWQRPFALRPQPCSSAESVASVDREERSLSRQADRRPAEQDARTFATPRSDRLGGDLPVGQHTAETRQARLEQGETPPVLRGCLRRGRSGRANRSRPASCLLGNRPRLLRIAADESAPHRGTARSRPFGVTAAPLRTPYRTSLQAAGNSARRQDDVDPPARGHDDRQRTYGSSDRRNDISGA
jgi:hypothetical protein